MSQLAIDGGPKAKPTGYNSRSRYGEEEKRLLCEAIDDGQLMYTSGEKVREFEEAVQERFGCEHAIMTTSGSAAIHIAMAAVGVAEGDEVITTAMGDAGTSIGIVAQHAIPIFADIDLDSATATLSPASAERLISERTKAILVVHMGGNIADLDAFLEMGGRHGIAIIEDCAQAHGGGWNGKVVGTLGDMGAYSMNESKHMTTGDGGFMTTNDAETARLARLISDKTYIRDGSVSRGGQPIPLSKTGGPTRSPTPCPTSGATRSTTPTPARMSMRCSGPSCSTRSTSGTRTKMSSRPSRDSARCGSTISGRASRHGRLGTGEP